MQAFQGSRGWPHARLAWLPGAVFAHDLAHRGFVFFLPFETIMEIA